MTTHLLLAILLILQACLFATDYFVSKRGNDVNERKSPETALATIQKGVELQDAEGKALPGFALADCEPIWGDHIARIVKWKGGDDVSAHAGKPVRLRFEMSDADLFSIRLDRKSTRLNSSHSSVSRMPSSA